MFGGGGLPEMPAGAGIPWMPGMPAWMPGMAGANGGGGGSGGAQGDDRRLGIFIRRHRILEDSFDALATLPVADWARDTMVHFENEPVNDFTNPPISLGLLSIKLLPAWFPHALPGSMFAKEISWAVGGVCDECYVTGLGMGVE
jgi:hypothetical protein